MKASKEERMQAEQISIAVDRLVSEPDAQIESIDVGDAGVLQTVQQLAQLPDLLGPVDPALERHVLQQAYHKATPSRRQPWLKLGWAVAGLATALLALLLLSPMGETAVASFLSVFNLGRTEVRLTPSVATSSLVGAGTAESAIRQSLTIEEAQAAVTFAIPQPAYLPPGYDLEEVTTVVYPNLPTWVPQPFLVELVYRDPPGRQVTLRLYSIALGDRASVARLDLEAEPIQAVQNVEINGQPGVLLQLGVNEAQVTLQEVVWEEGDLILALSAGQLTETDLLRIARSIHKE
jgi:hypothetical protein